MDQISKSAASRAHAVAVPTPVYEHSDSHYMVQYGTQVPYGDGHYGEQYSEASVMPCYPCPAYAEVSMPSGDLIQPYMSLDAYHSAYLQDSCSRHAIGPNGKPKRKRVATMAQRRAANIRERRRMFNLNEAFDDLRKRVPTFAYEKRLSRIETLRLAIAYISFMADLVKGKEPHEIRLAGIRSPGGWSAVRPQEGPTYNVVYDTTTETPPTWNDDTRSRSHQDDEDTNSSTVST